MVVVGFKHPRNCFCTQGQGVWMGARSDLDAMDGENLFPLPGIQTQILVLPVNNLSTINTAYAGSVWKVMQQAKSLWGSGGNLHTIALSSGWNRPSPSHPGGYTLREKATCNPLRFKAQEQSVSEWKGTIPYLTLASRFLVTEDRFVLDEVDRLYGLVDRVHGYRFRGLSSIPGAIRFSEN
jgi:hypothetical protein